MAAVGLVLMIGALPMMFFGCEAHRPMQDGRIRTHSRPHSGWREQSGAEDSGFSDVVVG